MAVYEFLMDETVSIKILDYLGNSADAKGMVTQISAPDMTQEMDQDLRIGEGGVVNRPTVYQAMESTITMKGISPLFYRYVAEAQASKREISIQVTGKGQDRYSNTVVDLKLTLKGFVQKFPLFNATAGEKSEMEMSLAVNALTQQVAEVIVYFEPGASKFEINGVNRWAA